MNLSKRIPPVLLALFVANGALAADAVIEWKYEALIDPFDDSISSHAMTAYSQGKNQFILGVRCRGGDLAAIFIVNEFLGGQPRPVRYRIDKETAMSGTWSQSINGTGVFAPDAESFARELTEGQQILIEVRGNKGFPYTARFNLEDAARHIEAVLRDCDPK